ncbi:S8 family serine peptidase [Streptomyces sp. NPDC000410]|uniref:S8 family peptidase n=1 Tax=Streptomyces sp. NPDC000410 TaxID=3154254 RepID=UPI0033283923
MVLSTAPAVSAQAVAEPELISAPAKSAQRAGAAQRTITLITGDRVGVDAKGQVVDIERAKGRERVPIQARTVDGHTHVVPADAQRLISDGKLDPRLFDVTELSRAENVKAQRGALKVIVGYAGAAAPQAKAEVKAAGGSKVLRSLKSLNADAVLTPRQDAGELWAALTDRKGTDATVASGIGRVWLDSVRKATLDTSVAQIGTPTAWSAGYDGKGVKIAVLDTGVDATHPDLKGQVIAEQNFSPAADAKDRNGHGTHVASIAAGTGAASGGTHKGVAPGAELLSGKVLDDEGYGTDSSILAGIEWAAAQGADVVNLSLGGFDSEEVDPLEAAVNRLSADKGILFAVAAGNTGDSVGSPGSADAALTVGAVDDGDALADFSSRRRAEDGAIKPDVTAPGVDITAAAAPGSLIEREVGQKPDGYLTISGTSMAAPHVAGAAALLKQRHPDWKSAELKGVLTGSTKGGPYPASAQGSGRVQVDRAMQQTVFAEPVSLNFGLAQWPHTDDPALTEKLTYRNAGDKDVTLDLAVTATDPEGQPAPDGFFALGATLLTVPAGGTASVDLIADTKLGGTLDGAYSAFVTATGGGQSVRTAAVVEREKEAYDVTFHHIGRDGKPTADYATAVGRAWYGQELKRDPSGTVKLRLPKGTYVLESVMAQDPSDTAKGVDLLIQPVLEVDKATTVTLDARTAKPVDITVPDPKAEPSGASFLMTYQQGQWIELLLLSVDSFANVRTAHLGPDVETGMTQGWNAGWTVDGTTGYQVALGGPVKRLGTGYERHLGKGDFATVKAGLGASVPGKTGELQATGWPGGLEFVGVLNGARQKLPSTRTLYVSVLDQALWDIGFFQLRGEGDSESIEVAYWAQSQTFQAGKKHALTFNTGVVGPQLAHELDGIKRDGNEIYGRLPVFADGKGHWGGSDHASVKTELHRDGTKIGENEDSLADGVVFTVPADDAAYRLTTSLTRSPALARTSSRVDASWTFRSKETAGEAKLPVSTVRFDAAVGLDSTAPAGRTQLVPVTVQGAAAGDKLKSLEVYVSYDRARTWTKVPVRNGKVAVRNPAKGQGIALRAEVTDKDGNLSTVAIHDAYFGR